MYTEKITGLISIQSLNILTLFNTSLFLLVKWGNIRPTSKQNSFISNEVFCRNILIILILSLIVIFFIGFSVPEQEGDRGKPSPIYEYSLILFLIYFHYCGFRKLYVIIGSLLVIFFSLQNFIFGGRILGIQFLLSAYIMLFMQNVKMYKVAVVMVFGFITFSFIGVARGNVLQGDFDIYSMLDDLTRKGFSLDTAYSAYYTSESFLYLLHNTTIDELHYFLAFLKSIFLGNSVEGSVLPEVSLRYVHHSYGGVFSFYFYFYLGLLGIVFSALFLSFFLNLVINLNKSNKSLIKLIVVWVVCNTFRWYLYTPLVLLRGIMFLSLAYYSASIFYKISSINNYRSS